MQKKMIKPLLRKNIFDRMKIRKIFYFLKNKYFSLKKPKIDLISDSNKIDETKKCFEYSAIINNFNDIQENDKCIF